MARQAINIGTGANTETGDDARTWAQKSNANFTELYAASNLVFVESFTATSNQSSFTVSEDAIADNGLWSVQIGSMLVNSTTGITAFVNGAITINFSTGVITFKYPLNEGENVIVKYN